MQAGRDLRRESRRLLLLHGVLDERIHREDVSKPTRLTRTTEGGTYRRLDRARLRRRRPHKRLELFVERVARLCFPRLARLALAAPTAGGCVSAPAAAASSCSSGTARRRRSAPVRTHPTRLTLALATAIRPLVLALRLLAARAEDAAEPAEEGLARVVDGGSDGPTELVDPALSLDGERDWDVVDANRLALDIRCGREQRGQITRKGKGAGDAG